MELAKSVLQDLHQLLMVLLAQLAKPMKSLSTVNANATKDMLIILLKFAPFAQVFPMDS
jgi:hypothetical protein